MNKLLGLLALSCLIVSCKKEKHQTPVLKNYLIQKTYSNIVERYFYDAQNRFSGMEYIDPSFTQTTTVTSHDANSNPTQYFIRTTGTTRVSKYDATYDAQNRPLSIVFSDSTGPATYRLLTTYTFIYTGNKQTRTTLTHSTGTTSTLEYTYTPEGNFMDSKFTNTSGVVTSTSSWSDYDSKYSPDGLLPHILNGGMLQSKNNQTKETYTNLATGSIRTYTATHLYNSDNYTTQTTYSGTSSPLVYKYTYEKR